MSTVKINGNTYSEFAVVADKPIPVAAGLMIPPHDYISNTYVADRLTQTVFKIGGAAGVTVGTLAYTYDGAGNVLTVALT